MTILTDEIRSYIGRQSERVTAADAVEPGAVRRYAQAIMADHDPDHPRQAEWASFRSRLFEEPPA